MQNLLENYKLEGKNLNIHTFPDPVLTKQATPVLPGEFNEELAVLCKDMLYTMYHAPGIGLAAPQIGISKRIFVVDVEYDRDVDEESDVVTLSNFHPFIFINPIIKSTNGEIVYQEGCLSLPGVYEDVTRFDSIEVEYQDLTGAFHTITATELFAICIQHENDHLDGIVFIDRLSNLKKNFFKKKLTKDKE